MHVSLGDHERLGQEEVEQGGHHRPAHLPGQEVGARVAETGRHHVAQYVDLAADTELYLVLSTAELWPPPHLSPSYSALAPEFCLNVSTTRAEFSAISNTTAAAAVSSSPSPGSSPSTSAAAKERAPWLADTYLDI